MIRIAICDDAPEMVAVLSQMVHSIMSEVNTEYEILKFQDGMTLLENIQDIDLLFLDIEMPEMDGIETGGYIIRQNPRCKIIIASAREDRMKETFKLQAMRFVSKPYIREEIQEALNAYMKTALIGMEEIQVFKDRKQYAVYQKDIQYIKAYNGAVNAVVADTGFRIDMTLNKLEELLDKRLFFRIHKAYIVGLFHVTDYNEKNVMIGSKELPISRRKRTEFEKALMEFDIAYRG